jgi:hypothetical protein
MTSPLRTSALNNPFESYLERKFFFILSDYSLITQEVSLSLPRHNHHDAH